MSPLAGAAARNKGMALFPRRLDGQYAMIARQDNENLYLIYSDDLYSWNGGQAILKPRFPWEFVQIGNCGSPIELDEGWLLLTHGVGPVRRYSIGAVLLDKADPTKILARSREPLVRPEPSDREGYVPNVVYTCGGMRHNDRIILPYAISDTFCSVATMKIAALLENHGGLIAVPYGFVSLTLVVAARDDESLHFLSAGRRPLQRAGTPVNQDAPRRLGSRPSRNKRRTDPG